MKNVQKYLFIIFSALFLQSCIANSPATKKKVTTTASTSSNPAGPNFKSEDAIYWFTSVKENNVLTVNKNSENVVFIRGASVHNFLMSTDSISKLPYYQSPKAFCLVGQFGKIEAGYKQLRLRAVPIFKTDYSTKITERFFRIDIPSASENSETCGGVVVDEIRADQVAFTPAGICLNCKSSVATSVSLKLFQREKGISTQMFQIPNNQLSLAQISLKVDLQSNSSTDITSCSTSSCNAKGFDCCIQGQCVKDATVKSSVNKDSTDYKQAMSEYYTDPLSFLKWPNIFNICTNTTHTPPPTTGGNKCTNSVCQTKGFDCCIQDQCVKDASLKTTAKDNMSVYNQARNAYNANPLSFLNWPSVFNICVNISHNPPATIDETVPTPLTEAEKRIATYLTDFNYLKNNLCINQDPQASGPVVDECRRINKKLAIACGCPSTYDDNTRAIKCPNWGVKPIYKSSEIDNNIVDFYCYAPVPENPIGPITNLNVNVSSRSAPHRFYEQTTGESQNELKITNKEQEGQKFSYDDEINKSSPNNGSYNVNSILGSMDLSLSQTQPAKMVQIELGKSYIVSATRGYFTLCSNCAKDSWFQNFSAHPTSTNGVGLRASGFSTSRDTYSANTTLGNYEDTHFGRACYIPVTMIPLSHKKEADSITQRLNRLTTQSAFYINGYQKDWYGFNKGALIGSFDGVTWFAVGSGRRITATTTKLFLAINSPFLDLADRTDTIVNIIPDISSTVAASYDFDPTLAIDDARQNSAGSCQQYHQCSTDTDCVSQLGWEYTCSDVSQNRTRWPLYDSNAVEIVNQERTGSLFEILSDTATLGNSSKRCVYRGAGAPCIRDITTLNGKINQKNLTCAPNFYCAALETNRFNDELARSPNEMDNILYGMDTNVLGRPLNYVTANRTLPSEVINNIKNNGASDALGLNASEVQDMGICRPGRSLNSNIAIAHGTPDPAKRADYINQIASCDSTANGVNRVLSCPAFGEDLNYVSNESLPALKNTLKNLQNFCGAESKNSVTNLSAFRSIEGSPLAILSNIMTPIFAADACMRRAGSVCHTDLDCGPNKLHEEVAGSMALSFFGGTEAEQSYWKESLICGQGTAVPNVGSSNYSTYKLSENRCCREIGKDFTMFTSGPNTLIPENGLVNVNLSTKQFSSLNPSALNRYSRYNSSPSALKNTDNVPKIESNKTPLANQWKVMNETGSQTCCGGGWIRKFADGSHDWKNKNRLSLETSNFSCINFRSPLSSSSYNSFVTDQVIQSTFNLEFSLFCKSPGQRGCLQVPFREINEYAVLPPMLYEPSENVVLDVAPGRLGKPADGLTRLDTIPVGDIDSGNYTFNMNSDVPYQPTAFTFSNPYDLYKFTDGTKRSLPFMVDKVFDFGLHIYLPAYIPYNSACATAGKECMPTVSSVYIKYQDKDGNLSIVAINTSATKAECDSIPNHISASGQPADRIAASSFCVSSSSKTQFRPVLSVNADGSAMNWELASVVIDFKPIEHKRIPKIETLTPGNPYYYLTKLGRLELIGIPQITYEPLYCSSDNNKLVPGIFNSSIQTRSQFEYVPLNATTQETNKKVSFINNLYTNYQLYDEENLASVEVDIGNPANRLAFQDKLAHGAVFSSKDFACCTPLGRKTTSGAKCCSGSATNVNGVMTCKIPTGTDLNVYFNKFVSSEGVGEEEPGGGLLVTGTDDEIDFNQFTGEPKMRTSTYLKLEELGKAYCISGIVGNGGAFGQFPPEPYSGYTTPTGSTIQFPISIVDSIIDTEAGSNNVGKLAFDSGFRWDHHYYCK